MPQFVTQLGPCVLASGAPIVLKSTPDEAVVSLDMIVLLMMFTSSASSSEIPAPSQPATLLTMMLFVKLVPSTNSRSLREGDHIRAVDSLEGDASSAASFPLGSPESGWR